MRFKPSLTTPCPVSVTRYEEFFFRYTYVFCTGITFRTILRNSKDVAEDGTAKPPPGTERTKVWLRRECTAGDASFLNGIRECMKIEAKIRGLDEPQKLEVTVPEPIRIIEVFGPLPSTRATKGSPARGQTAFFATALAVAGF